MMPRRLAGRQQGLVMVIALIMLLAVTLMVVAAANLVQANLKVVQNMEIRELGACRCDRGRRNGPTTPCDLLNPRRNV